MTTPADWRQPLLAELARLEAQVDALPRWHPRRWVLAYRLRRLSTQFDQGWQ